MQEIGEERFGGKTVPNDLSTRITVGIKTRQKNRPLASFYPQNRSVTRYWLVSRSFKHSAKRLISACKSGSGSSTFQNVVTLKSILFS